MYKYLLGLSVAALSSVAFSGNASAANAEAYCWFNSKDYYFCYGPTQRTLVGEKDISEPLHLAGCRGASRQNSFIRSGVHGGAWFSCSRKLEPYHNSPKKIRSWVNNQ